MRRGEIWTAAGYGDYYRKPRPAVIIQADAFDRLNAYDRGAETVVLGDRHGGVTEGPGFNLFLAERGALFTPDEGVLDGMTRRTAMELCEETGIPCRLERIEKSRLASADEVFLSSSGGGIIPVSQIDGAPVGNGVPGPLTRRLDALYWSKRKAGWHATPVDYWR